jgi:hypothetical protein
LNSLLCGPFSLYTTSKDYQVERPAFQGWAMALDKVSPQWFLISSVKQANHSLHCCMNVLNACRKHVYTSFDKGSMYTRLLIKPWWEPSTVAFETSLHQEPFSQGCYEYDTRRYKGSTKMVLLWKITLQSLLFCHVLRWKWQSAEKWPKCRPHKHSRCAKVHNVVKHTYSFLTLLNVTNHNF